MHHDSIHAIGHREGLEVALDGDGQRELVDEMHRGTGDDGTAAEVLQTEYCREVKKGVSDDWHQTSGIKPWGKG